MGKKFNFDEARALDGPRDENLIPLCVDLDGTLIRTDLLHEAVLKFIKSRASAIFYLIVWMLKGRLYLKRRLVEQIDFNANALPFRQDLLEFLNDERLKGREIHLVTASPQAWAQRIADHLEIFASATGSENENYKGARKAGLLIERHGYKSFDYIGDSSADVAVWNSAHTSHFAGRSARSLAKRVKGAPGSQFFDAGSGVLIGILKAARPHQWSKNLLLFVSIFAAHAVFDLNKLLNVGLAFVSLSLLASATYIINDLLDLESDRLHPRKCKRPFASGTVSVSAGLALSLGLFIAAVLAGSLLGSAFLAALAIYLVTTLSYSLRIKGAAIVDVVTLAGLYTLRIVAGTIAANIPISTWLLAFSMFCFISLAVAKRCAEITGTDLELKDKISGRGYYGADIEVLASMGVSSSFCATLVLCIYTTQPYVASRYSSPELLWLLCPMLLYVLNRILIMARRGHMRDDPIVFCASDRITIVAALIGSVVVGLAVSIHLPFRLIAEIGAT